MMDRDRIKTEQRMFPRAAAVCLAAVFLASSALGQPAAVDRKAGLLPPVIVLFEEGAGSAAPDMDTSAVAAVSAALVAEMSERGAPVVVISREEAGPSDLSRLHDLPGRMAAGAGPVPEALLSSPYASDRVVQAMERHHIDAFWLVSGAQVVPASGAQQGKRLVLRAALLDRKGTVLFSDMLDDPGDLRDPQEARRHIRKLLAEYRTDQQKAETNQATARLAAKNAAEPQHPHPAEFRVGLGVFVFADDGADLTVSFTPRDSRWQVGYRFVRWTDTFEDPYTGRGLTKTTESMEGPLVNFLFHPEAKGTWYLGVALLKWSRTEVSLMSGSSDSASVRALFYGGGYTGRLGPYFFYNLGMYLSPGTELKTNTGLSSEESSGGFDIQIQLGIAF